MMRQARGAAVSESGHPLTVNSTGMMNAKVRVFEERYSGGVLDMNIFCFAFINENDSNGSVFRGNSSVSSKVETNLTNGKKDIKDFTHKEDQNDIEKLEEDEG